MLQERKQYSHKLVIPRLVTVFTFLAATGTAVEATLVNQKDSHSLAQGLTQELPNFVRNRAKRVAYNNYIADRTSTNFGELARYRSTTGKTLEASKAAASRAETLHQTVEASLVIPFLGLINPGDTKRKFGMKQATLLVALAGIMWGCTSPAIRPTVIATERAPITATSTLIAPTSTLESTATAVVTPTEAAPKAGDKKTVTENGHDYRYSYDSELGWVRDISNFDLFDWPTFNSVPYKITVTEAVAGERNLFTMTHRDFTMADIPSSGKFDPPPMTATFMGQLQKLTGIKGPAFLSAVDGAAGHEPLTLPITISNGEIANVVLGPNSGMHLTIMTADQLKVLGGDNISKGYVNGVVYYAEVYGVDNQGNELCRLAFDVPLNQVPDESLRQALFMFPASLAEKKDQRDMGPTGFSIAFSHVSSKFTMSTPGISGTATPPDLDITYIQPQP